MRRTSPFPSDNHDKSFHPGIRTIAVHAVSRSKTGDGQASLRAGGYLNGLRGDRNGREQHEWAYLSHGRVNSTVCVAAFPAYSSEHSTRYLPAGRVPGYSALIWFASPGKNR